MTASILLRPPPLASPAPSPSPSPSPVSTSLPALQADLTSSSSSSSASGSYLDLHRLSCTPSTRRIRFAPLPDPNRDLLLAPLTSSSDIPQQDTKSATRPFPPPDDPCDDLPALSPSISPDSIVSSVRSTPTIRLSSKNTSKSHLKLRPFSFLRRAESSLLDCSPSSSSASLPNTRASTPSRPRSSSSAPTSPSFQFLRISTDDILSFGRKSFLRGRSGSSSSAPPPRTSSPPPKRSNPSKSLHRPASTSSGSAVQLESVEERRGSGQGAGDAHHTSGMAGLGPRKHRATSSSSVPGTGGGRHTSSVKTLPDDLPPRPSTSPSTPRLPPKKHVKMLNGRVYGAKRYAAQTLANPFANVRDEPEFVEWGYGGMGSVHASAGIANDMWRGLQRSERGGALLAGSSFGSPSRSVDQTAGAITAGGGRGTGARATSPIARRKMSDSIPECGMGNVGAGGGIDEDDGSGMGWVKRRRAEREAKARLEQEAKELERRTQEKRKSGDSMDASMYASNASTTTSLTACTSAASTDLTTPTTSPVTSRSPSVVDLKLTASSPESRGLCAALPCATTVEQSLKSVTTHPAPAPRNDHEHHVLTARLSPSISGSSRKHEPSTLSPVVKETTTSRISSCGNEPNRGFDEEEEQVDVDDDEHWLQDARRKTALGAGIEKISRHMAVEAR